MAVQGCSHSLTGLVSVMYYTVNSYAVNEGTNFIEDSDEAI